jgi:hypothetical protein
VSVGPSYTNKGLHFCVGCSVIVVFVLLAVCVLLLGLLFHPEDGSRIFFPKVCNIVTFYGGCVTIRRGSYRKFGFIALISTRNYK